MSWWDGQRTTWFGPKTQKPHPELTQVPRTKRWWIPMVDDNINKRGKRCKSFDAEVYPRQASLILLESKLKRLTSGRKRVAKSLVSGLVVAQILVEVVLPKTNGGTSQLKSVLCCFAVLIMLTLMVWPWAQLLLIRFLIRLRWYWYDVRICCPETY